MVMLTAASPDEAYADAEGTLHLLKRIEGGPSEFLVVVARKRESKTYLVTAHLIGLKRKRRGYRKFRKLALS